MTFKINLKFQILLCLSLVSFMIIFLLTLFWLKPDHPRPLVRRNYSVLKDYIKPDDNPRWNITLTTHASPLFLYHIEELVNRWDSAISVALYAPGDDFKMALNMVEYFRKCNTNIRSQVQWHFIFDNRYPPSSNLSDVMQLKVMPFCNCDISLADCMAQLNVTSSFRKSHNLTYPINILRNTARTAARTRFVLSSDIELYPSWQLPQTFLNLWEREERENGRLNRTSAPHVYTLPIFEIKANSSMPRTKNELVQLFNTGDAIYFHYHVCDECQNFPNRSGWIKQVPHSEYYLNVFTTARRTRERSSWEPIYIGTNDEPLYDERLTWEGKLDKMGQMLEMCLMGYELRVLDNAFLVHAPGIKYPSREDDQRRSPFMSANQMIHSQIHRVLRRKYGQSRDC